MGEGTAGRGGDAAHQGRRNSEPRWSASGKWLAFRKDYQVWMVRADGADAAAMGKGTMAKQFAWSPTEELLAYKTGVGSLRVAEPGDPNEMELVRQGRGREGTGVDTIVWSPDGAWIAFDSVELTGDDSQFLQQVRQVRADGSESKVVRENRGVVRDYLAGWSPDSKRLLFWQGMYSASLKADGFPLLVVPAFGGTPVQLSETMLTYQDFLSWSPDGQRLAIVDGGGRMTWERKAIFAATPAGATQRLSDQGRDDLFPAWSPDGRWIAFTSAPEAPGVGGGDPAKQAMAQRRIWGMQPDGTGKRELTNDPKFRDERPRWSTNGDYILFARLQDDQAQLWLMRADGSEQRQVVDELTPSPGVTGYYGYLNWGGLYDWWAGPQTMRTISSAAAIPMQRGGR